MQGKPLANIRLSVRSGSTALRRIKTTAMVNTIVDRRKSEQGIVKNHLSAPPRIEPWPFCLHCLTKKKKII